MLEGNIAILLILGFFIITDIIKKWIIGIGLLWNSIIYKVIGVQVGVKAMIDYMRVF